jgi:aminomethyltransferase
MSSAIAETPRLLTLDALHRSLGARIAPFAGYAMPIQYPSGLKAEHLHTRSQAGLFDVSHMGQLRIRARDGRRETLFGALESALPLDFDGWASGQQRYSLLLNEQGGIEDDLMMLRLDTDAQTSEIRMVVNASNRESDRAWLTARCPSLEIEWVDAALIALQGPQAQAVLAALDPAAASLGFMEGRSLSLAGVDCLATRSGYTGEDGYEISIPDKAAETIVRQLLAHPAVQPIGLGARDTLRLEAGLPLHGSDIGPAVTPIEAGLQFAIARSRRAGGTKAGGFPGAAIVLEQLQRGAPRVLVGLSSGETVPIRAHSAIIDRAGRPLGEVTSGTVSPTLGHPVMLALLSRAALEAADPDGLAAIVRQQRPAVRRVALPFVPKRYRRLSRPTTP